MTRGQINSRAHALAAKLGIDDAAFQEIVRAHDMNAEGHISKCTEFNALAVVGYLETQLKIAGTRKVDGTKKQQSMIPHLMEHLGWSWSGTASFCKRITGKSDTRECGTAELSKVIRGMIAIIDKKLEAGEITMNHTQKFEYDRHTKAYRAKKAA